MRVRISHLVAVFVVCNQIPTPDEGALPLVPKKRDGTPMPARAEALPDAQAGPYLLPAKGAVDTDDVVTDPRTGASMEIEEWQAIMNYLKSLPDKTDKGVTVLKVDERAKEDRSINLRVR